jgi:hypothetical protein
MPTLSLAHIPSYFLISQSESEGWDNQGESFSGDKTLYLWMAPSNESRACEMQFTGTLEVIELVPVNGFVNIGTMHAPFLVSDSCVDDLYAGEVVARIVVSDPTGEGGTICLEPSAGNGRLCGQVCQGEVWSWFQFVGYSSDGSKPCQGLSSGPECLDPVSVDASTWGGTKSLYR